MRTPRALPLLPALALAWAGCGRGEAKEIRGFPPPPASAVALVATPASQPARDVINPRLLRRFRPVAGVVTPPPPPPAQVDLGRMLWYDPRLSHDGAVSCNTCHRLSAYGMDGAPTSAAVRPHARRNVPTVYNAAEHIAQFWDGRAQDIEQQARAAILSPAEMAAGRGEVEARLRVIPGYRDLFRAAFPAQPEPVSLGNIARALAAFERGLITMSRWDQYLAGNKGALTAAEVHGLRVFLDVGCMGCHSGPQVGASMFQPLGLIQPWPSQDDLGRQEVTHSASDRMVFKVPTLRNVTRTAPYFHDGSCATLSEAVRLMGRHQLGIELADDEIDAMVTFLGALEGELPEAYILAPALPAEP